MVDSYTSIKEVIGKLYREVAGAIPSQYQDDIVEMIADGMQELQTTVNYDLKSTDPPDCPTALCVRNHVAKLPRGLDAVIAVENEYGIKIRYGSDVTDFSNQSSFYHSRRGQEARTAPSVFSTNPGRFGVAGGDVDDLPVVPIFGDDITPVEINAGVDYYIIKPGGYIQTSFESGPIRIHYLSIPLDEEGFPLIPDEVSVKEYLVWRTLGKLILMGVDHPTLHGLQGASYCDVKADEYSKQAMGILNQLSLDRMGQLLNQHLRLFLKPVFDKSFGIGLERLQQVRY